MTLFLLENVVVFASKMSCGLATEKYSHVGSITILDSHAMFYVNYNIVCEKQNNKCYGDSQSVVLQANPAKKFGYKVFN